MSTEQASNLSTLLDLAKEWLRLDKNPTTREAIQQLVETQDVKQLEALLTPPITFGTAGLRAKMEAGFARMNDLTVIQASQGLCAYVLEQVPSAKEMGIVVGFDHRYNSERFAKLTAAAFIHKGFKVYLYRQLVHTPMVPFGIQKLKAACGVMITASHNPKQDNGFKVYWSNGCQIVEPHDEGIANKIAINQEPWTWDVASCDNSSLCTDPHSSLWDAYFSQVRNLSSYQADLGSANFTRHPKFVYTPLHGVGGPAAQHAFESFKFPMENFIPVSQQFECNPDFPTVKFPNPEEKGTLDLAISCAEKAGATFVLGNDPDADRFSAAERQPDGQWIQFSGNQLGSILACQVWSKFKNSTGDKYGMLASAVSSKMLLAIGQKEGFHFEETLTGFKWLGNQAQKLESDKNIRVVFAYEEAIGFMIEDVVRDKDGITAMMTFVELAIKLAQEEKTVYQHLMEMYVEYGIFVDSNSYYICHDPSITESLFRTIRYGEAKDSSDLCYPTTLGTYKVTRVRDLTIGYDSSTPDNIPNLPVSSSTQMITFEITTPDNLKVNLTLRTSGTEPKIKYYSELSGEYNTETKVPIDQQVKELRLKLHDSVNEILDHLLHPSKYGLVAA